MNFTETHEWILVIGNEGTVGVSAFAQKELGDIVYIELPKVGKSINKGEEVAVLESTKAAADIYSPVSGTITAVNTALVEKPELVNSSPESDGWIYKINLSKPAEIDSLMNQADYLKKMQ